MVNLGSADIWPIVPKPTTVGIRHKSCCDGKAAGGEVAGLGAHDARFDFRFPDHVGRFQALYADLAMKRGAALTDPHNLILGAPVLTLHKNCLSHALDARWRNQTSAAGGDFIGAAIMGLKAGYVREHLHRHSQMQPFFVPFFSEGASAGGANRRSLLGVHDEFEYRG